MIVFNRPIQSPWIVLVSLLMLGETRKDVVRRYILSQMVFTDMSSGHSILIGHLGPSPHFPLVQKFTTITLGDTHTLLVSQMLLKLRSSENYEGNSQHTNKPCLAMSRNISLNCVEQIDLLVYHPKRRSGCDKMLMLWRCSVKVFSNLYQCIAIPGEFLQIITHRRTDGRI